MPQEFFDLYPLDSVPMPVQWQSEEWSQHPFQAWQRRMQALDEPVDEASVRKAIAAYYGMVTFLDHNIGQILRALEASGQAENTRIIYTTDHGEQLGEHGMWWKSSMLEASVGIPLIVAGPDMPEGKVSSTNVNLVDCFPGIVEAAGAALAPQDADLPGESIFRSGAGGRPRADQLQRVPRHPLAERGLHAPHGSLQVIRYIDMPPQLFDMVDDRYETRDLGQDPAYARSASRVRIAPRERSATPRRRMPERRPTSRLGFRRMVARRRSWRPA